MILSTEHDTTRMPPKRTRQLFQHCLFPLLSLVYVHQTEVGEFGGSFVGSRLLNTMQRKCPQKGPANFFNIVCVLCCRWSMYTKLKLENLAGPFVGSTLLNTIQRKCPQKGPANYFNIACFLCCRWSMYTKLKLANLAGPLWDPVY